MGLRSLGLWGGWRVLAFHCIASRSRISPKIQSAVVGEGGVHGHRRCWVSSLECCVAFNPGGFIANRWSQQLFCRSSYAPRPWDGRRRAAWGAGTALLARVAVVRAASSCAGDIWGT